jgi:hypothetical protein
MNDRLGTVAQLIAFSAFIAAVFIVVMTSLTFLSNQCTGGTPSCQRYFLASRNGSRRETRNARGPGNELACDPHGEIGRQPRRRRT